MKHENPSIRLTTALASAIGALAVSGCGEDRVRTTSGSGGTASGSEDPGRTTSFGMESNTSVQSPDADTTGDGSRTTDTGSSSSETEDLPMCRGAGLTCQDGPADTPCLCPEGLECTPNLPGGGVRTCLECDCPPDTTCWGDSLGGYECVPNFGTSGSNGSTGSGDTMTGQSTSDTDR